MSVGPGPVAVIITAIGEEYVAVREHMIAPDELRKNGTLYTIGTHLGLGGTWIVVLVNAGVGSVKAGVHFERAVREFSPKIVLFVGVAGALREVNLGDVVAADMICEYESGKDTESMYYPRIARRDSTYGLVQHATVVASQGLWRTRIRPVCPDPPPRAVVKPLAAGNTVVAHLESQTARLIAQYCSDAVAVDMESHGFLYGAQVNRTVEALVVRGISDTCTGKSEEGDRRWQFVAARNAAAFAFELLSTTPATLDASHLGDLYVEVLVDLQRIWAKTWPYGTVVGEVPELEVSDRLRLDAQVRAFASPEVRELYNRYEEACRTTAYYQKMIVVRNTIDAGFGQDHYQMPHDVRGLTRDELIERRDSTWVEGEEVRRQLESLIRVELNPAERLEIGP